jgi:hypothetical protein
LHRYNNVTPINYNVSAGPWREIKGPKDKLIRGLLVQSIKLATDFQCHILKYVYQRDNVIAVTTNFNYYYKKYGFILLSITIIYYNFFYYDLNMWTIWYYNFFLIIYYINFVLILDFLHWRSLYELPIFFPVEFTVKKGTSGEIYMCPCRAYAIIIGVY